jgi:hypothetical protein
MCPGSLLLLVLGESSQLLGQVLDLTSELLTLLLVVLAHSLSLLTQRLHLLFML